MRRFLGIRGDENPLQLVWRLRIDRVDAMVGLGLPLSLRVGWRAGRRATYVWLDLLILSFGILYTRRSAPKSLP